MSVNWNWKQKKGVIYWKTFKGIKAKVNLYNANCLGALINEFKDKETEERMYEFIGYWNDELHLKDCLGLTKQFKGKNLYKDTITKIKLNTYYKDWIKIARNFAKSGIKVELYYKEPKK